jgi:hypothetical protein
VIDAAQYDGGGHMLHDDYRLRVRGRIGVSPIQMRRPR